MRLILAAVLLFQAKEDPARPAARVREYAWMSTAAWKQRHEANLKKPKDAELVFVGDSITEGWGNNAVWQKHYPKAVNLGIGGDTTQNVLWRLENGEADGLAPKAVVVLIGTNNFGLHGDQPKDVARGVIAVVRTIRRKLPKAKVLLLGIFPRDANPNAGIRESVRKVNAEIAALDDRKTVRFLDLGAKLLAPDGSIAKEIMPDALHLSEKGYAIWAESMNPLLGELMK